MSSIGTWVAAILTLAMLSFLYKENPVSRIAEHIMVGVALGATVLLMYYAIFTPYVVKAIVSPKSATSLVWTLVFTAAGVLFLSPFVPRIGWLARIPAAIAVGYVAGQELPAAVQARLFPQILSTVTVFDGVDGVWAGFSAVVILVGTVSVLFYFMMTFRRGPVLHGLSRVGVVYLMVGFGAVYGNMVISRFTNLIDRLRFLFGDWLGILAG